MRITFLTSKLNFETGGGSNSDLDLKTRTFQMLGNDVKVVTVFSDSNRIPTPLLYPVIEEKVAARDFLGIAWHAFRILKKYTPQTDIFYIDGHNFLYGAGWYRLFGDSVPVVAFFNRELGSWRNQMARFIHTKKPTSLDRLKQVTRYGLEKYVGMPIASAIDLHLFTSPAYRQLYESFGLRFKREPLIVGDLLDVDSVMKKHHVFDKVIPERTAQKKQLIIFFSGRLVPMRGADLLIKAFSEIESRNKTRLIISGDGPEAGALKKLTQALNIESSVEFTGWVERERIYDVLKKSDIFVIPKGNGATSVALLEAMAFGLASVVPNDNALSWVAGEGALTFNENDHHGLAKQLTRLIEDPELRKTVREGAIRRLEETNYKDTISKTYDAMKEVLRK